MTTPRTPKGIVEALARKATQQEYAATFAPVEKLIEAAREAEAHLKELREAWQRGALCEYDGQGGTRSNRNMDVLMKIRATLQSLEDATR